MTTQSGITVEAPGKPFILSSNIPRRTPSGKQALVKCIAVGLNPVEPFQQQTGVLVDEWPAVLGSDYFGVVTEVGPDCKRLKPGDHVYSCVPIGQNKYTPLQDTFLAEEDSVLKQGSLSLEDACTIGAALFTSALCLFSGMDVAVPDANATAPSKDEWIVILGGSGSVGQLGVQLARICGYKVAASCSPSKASIPLHNGASATFDNRASVDDQVAEIKKITGGNFARIYDTTAHGYDIMVKALETCSTASKKYLATVDDWSEFKTPSSIVEYRVELGHLCRPKAEMGHAVTSAIAQWIPTFEDLFAKGILKPLACQVVDGAGWDKVLVGLQDLQNGKAAKKIVVKVVDEK